MYLTFFMQRLKIFQTLLSSLYGLHQNENECHEYLETSKGKGTVQSLSMAGNYTVYIYFQKTDRISMLHTADCKTYPGNP